MSFILRFVLILLIFAFIVYVMKMIARLSHRLRGTMREVKEIREQVGGRSGASANMVRCSKCGSFVSTRDAVTITARNKLQSFCSTECARAHIAS